MWDLREFLWNEWSREIYGVPSVVVFVVRNSDRILGDTQLRPVTIWPVQFLRISLESHEAG